MIYREIDNIEAQGEEILKLHFVVSRFSEKMFAKLRKKQDAGDEGWDEPDMKEFLIAGFLDHLDKPLTKNNLVDIANYCMFLYYQEEVG